ncbi:MAG: hypothetical protein WBH56_15510 [Bacteroidota bacterium]
MTDQEQNTFEQIPYDKLTLQRKETGDSGSTEYIYQGLLGTYKLRIGESITDAGKLFYIYFNNKFFANLYPTRVKKVFVGKDEEEGDFYIFRFNGKDVNVFKRKYDF